MPQTIRSLATSRYSNTVSGTFSDGHPVPIGANNAEDLVDWKPVAKLLGVRKTAFWQLVHSNDFPPYRLKARVIRFRMSAVMAWLDAREREGRFLR